MPAYVSGLDWYKSRRGSLLMTLFCSVFLIVGLISAIPTIGMSLDWLETEGVVIEARYDAERLGYYFDHYEYESKIQFVEQRTGKQIIAIVDRNKQEYSVGQKITVLYNPRILELSPSRDGFVRGAVVVKDAFFYVIPIGFVGFGGLGTFGFLRLFIRSWSQKSHGT